MPSPRAWILLTISLLAAGVFLLYAPALGFELRGDDFQWVHLAHQAQLDQQHLAADLDSFYRPMNVWTLLVDRLLWGNDAAGFRVTNLVLHVLAALALALAARRLGLSRLTASVVALVWATSPFSQETAIWVSARFQGFLLIAWCGVIAVWPRNDEAWSWPRRLGVAALLALGAASKESWVVIPAAGALLEYRRTGGDLRRTTRAVLPLGLAAAVYVLAYFTAFPGDKNYFAWDLAVLAKIPHMIAAFLHFQELMPLAFPWNWQSVLALVALIGGVTYGIRRHSLPAELGSLMLALSVLPVLLVPYLPTRHTYIPYAGFLLLVAALVEVSAHRLPARYRRTAALAGAVFVALVLAAGVTIVRADLVDFRFVSEATARLIEESRAAGVEFEPRRPVIVVRDESVNPLTDVSRVSHGRLKIWYTRHEDPYGLVDAAALFDWSLEPADGVIRRVDDWEQTLAGVPGLLVLHRQGGFTSPAEAVADVAAEARRFRNSGRPVRVVVLERREP